MERTRQAITKYMPSMVTMWTFLSHTTEWATHATWWNGILMASGRMFIKQFSRSRRCVFYSVVCSSHGFVDEFLVLSLYPVEGSIVPYSVPVEHLLGHAFIRCDVGVIIFQWMEQPRKQQRKVYEQEGRTWMILEFPFCWPTLAYFFPYRKFILLFFPSLYHINDSQK